MKLSRKILKITGPDRVRFLNDLLTVSVCDEMPLAYGALLSAQGKIFADLFIWSESDAHFLDIHQSVFAEFKQKLQIYKLRANIEISEDEREVFQCLGEGDPRGMVGARNYQQDDGWSEAEYREARIQATIPEFGVDFESNQAYPREWQFDEMGGINYKKGCFVGQEIVARMRHKSDLNKSVVKINAEQTLQTGADVTSNGKQVGQILSTSGNKALAFLRIRDLNPNELLSDGIQINLSR